MAIDFPEVAGVDLVLQPGDFVIQLVRLFVGNIAGEQFPDFVIAVELGLLFSDAFHHNLFNRGAGGELRFLFEVADFCVFSDDALADKLGVDAGHNLEQAGFSGAVAADYADARAEKEGQVNIFQNGFCTMLFGEVFEGCIHIRRP